MICPLLRVCKAKVSLEHYTKYCTNISEDAYLNCPEYKKVAGETKTPADWAKLLMPSTRT